MSELKVNTISEVTGANGVVIDSVKLKDGEVYATKIQYTDGDDAITIADGGGITVAQAATFSSTIDSGAITSTGIVTGTAFTAGSAVLAEAELELLDGLTAGTAIASKVVTTDANIDTTGQRNLTISGELDAATLDISGAIDVAGTTNLDVVDIDGAVDMASTLQVDGVATFTAVPVFPNNTIETADIQADAITGAKIADDAIDSEHYTDGSIDTAHLANGAVTGGKIGDDQITAAKTDTATNGTVEASKIVTTNSDGTVTFPDSAKVRLGNGADLQLYHDSNNSYIDNAQGNLYIRDTAGDIILQAKTDEHSIICKDDGSVDLYYNNAKKFETSNAGGTLTGDLVVTDDLILNSDSAAITFGADGDQKLFHLNDTGLILQSTATGDDSFPIFSLQPAQATININDLIGVISFAAASDTSGGDANATAAAIEVKAEADFSSSVNASKMSFKTGASEAATTKMSIFSNGRVVSQSNAGSWMQMNGTGGVQLNDSYNLAGISDNGTGSYDMTHAVDFSNDDYAVAASCNLAGGSISNVNSYVGTANVIAYNAAGSVADPSRISAIAFGDMPL